MDLVRVFRSLTRVALVGAPDRDLWAAMRCVKASNDSEARVRVTVSLLLQPGPMGDTCLQFIAMEDLEPFGLTFLYQTERIPIQGHVSRLPSGISRTTFLL